MKLSEIATLVKRDGVKAYGLGILRDAYAAEYSETVMRRNSKRRMPLIKEALLRQGVVMWPDVLPSLEASRVVYLASRKHSVGMVFTIQRLDPAEGLAQVLADLGREVGSEEAA
ncbi:hypothetical protein [Nonomuraea endophytica]|uniref:Uncharacterized protein n=1 Tax=Nonomuraea endophytica TaxID=714136 RepID=A0A7W8EIL6_9ACTN|nr:hypothetical protein [Nonomuraea endophytica]MBB5080693.1 hypothetical protein [Nonomuraea endophytica]